MSHGEQDIAARQAAYYGSLYEQHGPGVDAVASGNQVYKNLRYEKLASMFGQDHAFSVHDVGCGVGHFYEFLGKHYPERKIDYSGTEITPAFVEHCKSVYPDKDFQLRDLSAAPFPEKYDYLVFGGTFYHLAGSDSAEFWEFVKRMLTHGFMSARKGIAVNFVTGYVGYRLPDLFYGDVGEVTRFISSDLSRFFTVDHASPLFEHTICVYRDTHIRQRYADPAFGKYFKPPG
ncbi:class I SAM-dependent methyltransferase [Luteimonas sp. SJ-92]|uniref:Class I SAM-dependent methyltransferase n=1 Tax=Luteimonas salinisoli TaxID=2752307 RepID=A0A853J8X7_9GAMM|nr:class I SAM-dependent methyltransferase [Luteimonas salinisoli]NZA25315.1 class I SAM-dependent methyltransferase [Luteimonas salinisoli]